jgi:NAD(P)H-dependent flavin oxidoreductase YrpB (nitropropane dioxygenase family)
MALYNAAKGNMNKGYAFAGANAYLAEKISSVREVIQQLKEEFINAQNRLSTKDM